MDASPVADVPDFDGIVERSSNDLLTIRVKVQGYYLRRMAKQGVQTFAGLHIPESGCVVH